MNQTTWQRFALNAENQLKSGSTYVAAIGALVLVMLSTWPDLAKAIDQIPLLKGYGAGLTILIGVLTAKFRPSAAMSTQLQAAIVEIARLKANNVLKDHGSELAIPQAAAAAALPEVPISVALSKVAPPNPAPPTSAPTPVPVPVPVDVDVSKPPPLPIDTKLLLSVVKEYLEQQTVKPA